MEFIITKYAVLEVAVLEVHHSDIKYHEALDGNYSPLTSLRLKIE